MAMNYKSAAKRKQRRLQERAQNPLESEEQIALFEWANIVEKRKPELKLMYHVPNGGLRDKVVAMRLKAEGVRSGVPDICLPVARQSYHGLYIELKRRKGGKVTADQKKWIERLIKEGYKVAVCCGFDEAKAVIEEYLEVEIDAAQPEGVITK